MCNLHIHAPLPFPVQHQSVVNELRIINSGQIMAKLKITTILVGQVMLSSPSRCQWDGFPLLYRHKKGVSCIID